MWAGSPAAPAAGTGLVGGHPDGEGSLPGPFICWAGLCEPLTAASWGSCLPATQSVWAHAVQGTWKIRAALPAGGPCWFSREEQEYLEQSEVEDRRLAALLIES